MSIPKALYFSLAVAGVTTTWFYNFQFMQESGGSFDLAEFLAASSSNAAAQSLSWDLAVACVAGLIWMFFESRRLAMRFFWIYVLLTFFVAYAFAFPLFLFIRQGKLENLEKQKSSPASW